MMNALTAPVFDPELIARYDTLGPRYTSYPTAPQFTETFGEPELRAAIRATNEEPIPSELSLYVHIPFCFSPCFYCGCTRLISRDIGKADAYLERLYKEIALTASLFDRDRVVRQLHFGGGTPNFLDLPRMRELLQTLRRHFKFSRDDTREYSIELDPRSADAEYVRGLAEAGMNRMSIGVQDFDPKVQEAVNRVQSVERVDEIMRAGREHGFNSISVDLIYGLPHQTPDSFARTLEQVIALDPDRIATYSYAHLPERFKAQRRLDAMALPEAASKLEMFGRTLEMLTAAGYVYIGMDHFARADDELARAQREGTLQRNFQGYSTHRDCDIMGLGMSSIGRIGNTYSQNVRDIKGYYAMLDAGHLPVVRGLQLSDDDLIRRELIGELMCHGHLDTRSLARRHRLDFANYFDEDLRLLSQLQEDGLVTLGPDVIEVTPRGRLLIRHVAMCFDPYLRHPREPIRYSRAI